MVTQDLKLLLEGDAKSFIDALNRATHHLEILRGGQVWCLYRSTHEANG